MTDQIELVLQDENGNLTLAAKLNILFIIQQNGFGELGNVEIVLSRLFNTDVISINKALEELESSGIRFNRKWNNPLPEKSLDQKENI